MIQRPVLKSAAIAGLGLTMSVGATFLVSTAGAQTTCGDSYNPTATITASPKTNTAGSTESFTGTGWAGGCPVTVTVTGSNVPNVQGTTTVGTVTPDASGNISASWGIPTSVSGTVTVTGTNGTQTASDTFNVTASGTAGTGAGSSTSGSGSAGNLPYTGSDTVRYAGAGLALVAAGGMLVFVTRRRRPVPAPVD